MAAGIRPSVITFEHEAMSGEVGKQVRKDSREFLKNQGFELVIKDVSNIGVGSNDLGVPYPVEDWWVLPERINQDIFNKLRADIVEYIASPNTVYNLQD